ncbi:MAG: hypothetical protein ACRD1H_19535 [Vicinamibacterales bacterium]
MRDDSTRDPYDAPIETEGMGGAGGGDLDDVGDVGFPREGARRGQAPLNAPESGMVGAGGGDRDDLGDASDPDLMQATGAFPSGTGDDIEIARELGGGALDTTPDYPAGDLDVDDILDAGNTGSEIIRGETGVVTGITTGVGTDDDTREPSGWRPGSPWENLDDGLGERDRRGTDTPT